MSASPARPAGLSVFFPAYNDSGTIASMVIRAVKAASDLTPDYEVIVVNDGSADATPEIVDELARTYSHVRVVHHPKNRGYGGALQTGFRSATKELIFYTDGDAQYDPAELELLVDAVDNGVDVVQGYKIRRADAVGRRIAGWLYQRGATRLFGLRVRDVDCDFRLIRRELLERVRLFHRSGVICVEMVRKFQDAGARFVEVPVHHYPRHHGHSQFFTTRRVTRALLGLARLRLELLREPHAATAQPAPAILERPKRGGA